MYKEEARGFLNCFAQMGVEPSVVSKILIAYNSLSNPAKSILPDLIREQNRPAATLRDAFAYYNSPVNIRLTDNAGNCRDIPDIPPNSASYTHMDEWLMSLPAEPAGIDRASGIPTVNLRTHFAADELYFLGFEEFAPVEPSAALYDMCSRADMACADFRDRLSYLSHGKSFEIAFDPNKMDVVHNTERQFLCEFLQDYTDIYVRPSSKDPDVYYVYGIMPDVIPVDFDLLGIKLKETEPGKGLTSTVDGKCAWAEHRAKKARSEVMETKKQQLGAHSAGKEFTL